MTSNKNKNKNPFLEDHMRISEIPDEENKPSFLSN